MAYAGEQATALKMRRDLHRLVALEWTQTALGVGLLVAIATRAVVTAGDESVAMTLLLTGVLALVFLALALRIRMGHESLRRDLQRLEIRAELASRWEDLGGAPYRDRR